MQCLSSTPHYLTEYVFADVVKTETECFCDVTYSGLITTNYLPVA